MNEIRLPSIPEKKLGDTFWSCPWTDLVTIHMNSLPVSFISAARLRIFSLSLLLNRKRNYLQINDSIKLINDDRLSIFVT